MAYNEIEKRVVYIEASSADWMQSGTGFLLQCEPRDVVITCRHIIKSPREKYAETIKVWPPDVAYNLANSYLVNKINSTEISSLSDDAKDLVILELSTTDDLTNFKTPRFTKQLEK